MRFATPFSAVSVALRGVDVALRLVARRRRLTVATRLAVRAAPLLRRTGRYPPRPNYLDGYREHTLMLLLDRMTRRGLPFDLTADVRGAESLGDGGALVVGGHFSLTLLGMRWAADRGLDVALVHALAAGRRPLHGTPDHMQVLAADRRILLRLREAVARGTIVAVPLDRTVPLADGREIATPRGPRYISDRIMRFAERTGIRVVFIGAHLDARGRVVIEFQRPSSRTGPGMFEEFDAFLRAQLELVDWS